MQPQPSATSTEKHPHTAPPAGAAPAGRQPQIDFSEWVAATSDPGDLQLGEEGFAYPDLFAPERLAVLTERFDAFFLAADPAAHAQFAAYRACRGEGMKAEAISEALLAGAPHLARFVARLFRVERETEALMEGAQGRGPLWAFKKEFAKKRLFKASAGSGWKGTPVEAAHVARHALVAMGAPSALLDGGSADEELAVAEAVLLIHQIDDTARKVAKAGGASWTDELRERAAKVRAALSGSRRLDDGAVAALRARRHRGLARRAPQGPPRSAPAAGPR